jgi:hypothetical protein
MDVILQVGQLRKFIELLQSVFSGILQDGWPEAFRFADDNRIAIPDGFMGQAGGMNASKNDGLSAQTEQVCNFLTPDGRLGHEADADQVIVSIKIYGLAENFLASLNLMFRGRHSGYKRQGKLGYIKVRMSSFTFDTGSNK